jgi:hypothetical protein
MEVRTKEACQRISKVGGSYNYNSSHQQCEGNGNVSCIHEGKAIVRAWSRERGAGISYFNISKF